MKWWDDLWLNEAFATFIAFKAVDRFHPDWHIWDDLIEADTKRALAMDMLSSTHPIVVPVHTPNEVEERFDAIGYGKGASVLDCLHNFSTSLAAGRILADHEAPPGHLVHSTQAVRLEPGFRRIETRICGDRTFRRLLNNRFQSTYVYAVLKLRGIFHESESMKIGIAKAVHLSRKTGWNLLSHFAERMMPGDIDWSILRIALPRRS